MQGDKKPSRCSSFMKEWRMEWLLVCISLLKICRPNGCTYHSMLRPPFIMELLNPIIMILRQKLSEMMFFNLGRKDFYQK